ncbi:MAG TPA: lasso RiPP family leader peptide-containing protein [Solirubrobacteraceae bacterium]|jgi:hypothetical protein|nr:lasso RiPP family leader peptide-containing protein [Solirubrobacteraceae bacterium]
MAHVSNTDENAYQPPRLRVLGSVQVLTQSTKTLGLGDGILFWQAPGGGGGVSHTS